MSKRDTALLLEDILDSASKIKKYAANMDFETFVSDEKTIDAVVRNFEIIGEAANQIDSTFKSNHSHLEWNRLRGLRNRIVHEYFGIDHKIVWSIIQNDLDEFVKEIEVIIQNSKS